MHPISQQRIRLIYITFSLILSLTLWFTAILDIILLKALKRPDLTTHQALTTLLVSCHTANGQQYQILLVFVQNLHVIAFYLAILGIIHAFESKSHPYIYRSTAIISAGNIKKARKSITIHTTCLIFPFLQCYHWCH